ncbi:MAG: hypothetical protein IT463_01145 [Planctomycetes bacterium]|nr:hypothetical protein [Planctomycetota bacterium]
MRALATTILGLVLVGCGAAGNTGPTNTATPPANAGAANTAPGNAPAPANVPAPTGNTAPANDAAQTAPATDSYELLVEGMT